KKVENQSSLNCFFDRPIRRARCSKEVIASDKAQRFAHQIREKGVSCRLKIQQGLAQSEKIFLDVGDVQGGVSRFLIHWQSKEFVERARLRELGFEIDRRSALS